MTEAKITFVIPAYNPGEFLAPCLQSLLDQTDPAWQAIVIDDGSKDWPDAPQLQDPRITLLKTPNRGVCAARNLGLSQVKTELVSFLDADDLLDPTYVEKMTAPLEADPNLDLTFCDGQLLWMYESPESNNTQMPFGPADQFHQNLKRRPMNLGPLVFRKEKIDHVGGFDLTLSSASEDWDFLLKATPELTVAKIEEPLFAYRLTSGSMSRRYDRLYILTDHMLERLAKHDREPKLTQEELKAARHHLRNWAVREMRTQRQNGTDNGKTTKLLAKRPELWFWFLVRLLRR